MLLKLYKISIFLSIIGLLAALMGLATHGAYPKFFTWLFFYLPCLWVLWICCLFLTKEKQFFRHLYFLWMMIDLAILVLFMAFSINVEHWSHARGLEIGLFIVYFPIALPTGFLLNLIPQNAEIIISTTFETMIHFFGGGIGDAFVIWLSMSLISILQTILLIAIKRFFMRMTP